MQGREVKGLRLSGLEQKLHPYLIARLVEIEALLNDLPRSNDQKFNFIGLDPQNLKTGPILDLGTGSGCGLIALRRQTLAPIFGVDQAVKVPRATDFGGIWGVFANDYCGAGLQVPEKNVLDLSVTDFQRSEIMEFLRKQPLNTFSLVTMFYIGDEDLDFREFLTEVGLILRPEGQLLITSDSIIRGDNIYNGRELQVKWGTRRSFITCDDPTLDVKAKRPLPAPKNLIDQIGSSTVVRNICGRYLEQETDSNIVSNFRDRNIWIFTKD